MRYRLVIFDFDGTLADSFGWMLEVIGDVARRYRFAAPRTSELELLRGKDTRAILAHLGVSTWKLPFIARHMRKRIARETERIALFPGVPELLEQLASSGATVAIVSSNAEANVRAILGAKTAAHVRFYACGAGLFGKRKKFRDVLSACGVSREETIAIGDELRDLTAAREEGIASGAVSWGYATPEILRAQAPTVMFERFEDLRRVLLG